MSCRFNLTDRLGFRTSTKDHEMNPWGECIQKGITPDNDNEKIYAWKHKNEISHVDKFSQMPHNSLNPWKDLSPPWRIHLNTWFEISPLTADHTWTTRSKQLSADLRSGLLSAGSLVSGHWAAQMLSENRSQLLEDLGCKSGWKPKMGGLKWKKELMDPLVLWTGLSQWLQHHASQQTHLQQNKKFLIYIFGSEQRLQGHKSQRSPPLTFNHDWIIIKPCSNKISWV